LAGRYEAADVDLDEQLLAQPETVEHQLLFADRGGVRQCDARELAGECRRSEKAESKPGEKSAAHGGSSGCVLKRFGVSVAALVADGKSD
jgi:hypothetical protein